MRLFPRHLWLPAGLALAACQAPATLPADHAAAGAVRPVSRLDLPRYMGHWYEIARLPNRFQQDCATDSQADYRLQPDGGVAVENRCRRADGSWSVATGEARRIGPPGSARLEVRFAPAWLSFLPAVWGDYWVLDLDAGYTLAAVGSPDRRFLWVLARQPVLAPERYRSLRARLAARGYPVERLVAATPAAPASPVPPAPVD